MPDVHDLGLLMASHVPLIVIQSSEESRVIDTLTRLSIKSARPLYQWTVTEGLQRLGFGFEMAQDENYAEPEKLLRHLKTVRTPGIYALCDFHPWLGEDPRLVRLVKDIALKHHVLGHTLVFVSHAFVIPPELRGLSANFEIRLPGTEQILAIIREEAAAWSKENEGGKVRTDNRTLQQLVRNLGGLTVSEVRRLARAAIVDDGAIDASDIPEVNKAKFELMDLGGVLSYEFDTANLGDVGGLASLKHWLKRRHLAFFEGKSETRLDPPRGILLLGVQGGGKSLAAKAVAGTWNLPLLRLDMGALYNKFFGETERNLREALKLAELMAPCVLWIDEIEKGISQAQNDEGVSRRVLATLLTWMAERSSAVFLVATANDISALPPELMRKGRFDEIFFVDLPDAVVRRDILAIHLRKRQLDPVAFDLEALAMASDGFSGAEIEQAVVSGLYRSAAEGTTFDNTLLLEELRSTQPLSVIMAEDFAELRQWARHRCVPAN